MKNKRLVAIYRTERNGNLKNMVQEDYETKKDFMLDLKANGFKVLGIFTESQIQHIRVTSAFNLPLSMSDRVIEYIKQLV